MKTGVGAAAIAFALVACQGGGGGDGYDGGLPGMSGASGGASAAELADLLHESCELYRRCCEDEGLSIEPLADCEMQLQSDPDVGGTLDRGTVRLNQQAYDQCVSALRTSTCFEMNTGAEPCLRAFQGTVPNGGECMQGVECMRASQPVACVREPGAEDTEPGVCRDLMPANAGEPCRLTIRSGMGLTYVAINSDVSLALAYCDLDRGLVCDPSTAQCLQLVGLGSPCTGNECTPSLYCDGVCKAGKPEGSPCTAQDECGELGWCPEGTCRKITVADTEICEGDLVD